MPRKKTDGKGSKGRTAVSREWAMLLRWIHLLCLAVGSWSNPLPDNQFQTLSYATVVSQLHDLADNYPHLAKVLCSGVCMHRTSVRSSTGGAGLAARVDVLCLAVGVISVHWVLCHIV